MRGPSRALPRHPQASRDFVLQGSPVLIGGVFFGGEDIQHLPPESPFLPSTFVFLLRGTKGGEDVFAAV